MADITFLRQYGRKSHKIIAVTSGKGGVGKTNVTANLALVMADEGMKTLVVDADLGLSNMDLVLGAIPEYTIRDVLFGGIPVEEAIAETRSGVDLLAASAGDEDLANLGRDGRHSFMELLESLREYYDIIFMDTGAGVHSNVTGVAGKADYIVLVTTPEPTALSSAYAMVKILHAQHDVAHMGIVVNMAASGREGLGAYNALIRLSERFLAFKPDYLGHIYQDPSVPKAVHSTYPLVRVFPRSAAARSINSIAAKLRVGGALLGRDSTGHYRSGVESWL